MPAMPVPPVIETAALTKRYADGAGVTALDLTVGAHRITGFLGRNGAGKSTTLKMLLGMTHPTSGTGSLLGRSITDAAANRDARRHVAYVGEDKRLYDYLTVGELIRFTRSFYADWRPDVERELLAEYQLPVDRAVKALSKGMRTKLALLLALARRPTLLILDEPSEGLDPVSIEELLRRLVATAADGTTVFFSSHQISEVERVADQVCILDRGRLVLDVALDDVRHQFRRVTLGFDAPPAPDQLLVDGIHRVQLRGRQAVVLAPRNAEAVSARARELGAVSIDVAPIGLRDVFLESVRADDRADDHAA